MEEDVKRSKTAGFEVHLTKPVNFSSLTAAIHRIIPPFTPPSSPTISPTVTSPSNSSAHRLPFVRLLYSYAIFSSPQPPREAAPRRGNVNVDVTTFSSFSCVHRLYRVLDTGCNNTAKGRASSLD
jgi:hypothetical protein